MGWTRAAKLVRCFFFTGFECEGHSLVNSRPETIGVIVSPEREWEIKHDFIEFK